MISDLLCNLFQLYFFILLARIVLSWFPLEPGGAMATVFSFLYGVTEPVLGPIRRLLPPIGMGGMGIDLSPIIVIFGLRIIMGAVLGC